MIRSFFSLLLTLCVIGASAQLSPTSINVPMRDGQTLAADLYVPPGAGPYPTILIQTPYNKNFYETVGLPAGIGTDLSNSPYAFVVLDRRCFYGSLGACNGNPNEGEDGYDAVEWIATQSWSDGQVATWGPSALAIVQFQTAREQPPSLVCCVPEVGTPRVHYEGYYEGGVIRAGYLATIGVLFGSLSGNSIIVNNPTYNLTWQFVESSVIYPDEIEVPMLMVGGWFDHNTNDCLFYFNELATNGPASVRDQHKLVMGPWVHGGTGQAHVGSAIQGDLSFPSAAGDNDSLERAFFNYHLLGLQNGWEYTPPITYFQMGDNYWAGAPSWPHAPSGNQYWFLHDDNTLQAVTASNAGGQVSFNYDPTDPSPTVGGKTLSLGIDQGPYDQAPLVESRSDAITFTTPVLTEDVVVQGEIEIELYVSSDRPDTDFSVRLTEVYPDDRSISLGETIQRMRFRTGYTDADTSAITPGVVYPIYLKLDEIANTFKAGNRIRLVISSSNYPLFNRNMNTGGEMYPNGNIDTLVNPVVAQNTVWMDPGYLSSVMLPLGPTNLAVAESLEEKITIEAFPNPAHDVVNIALPAAGGVLNIYDAQGKLIRSEKEIDGAVFQWEVSGLPGGVYVVSWQAPDGRMADLKVVVE